LPAPGAPNNIILMYSLSDVFQKLLTGDLTTGSSGQVVEKNKPVSVTHEN